MNQNIKLQKDYTTSCLYYQIKLPLNIEKNIPSDDPVRLLSAFVEGMELSDLYRTYGKIKKDQASPRQLLKIVIYAGMNRIYSSRDIEKSCKRDINFMYLLEGKPAPDHATISRFISLHLSQCSKNILAEVSNGLYELGEISGRHIFIDGTKIESAANRYSFVWKKAVYKNQAKLIERITDLVAECEEMYGLKLVYKGEISIHSLKRIRKKLYAVKESENISFVHGAGRRKSAIQRSIETLECYIERLKEYTKKIYACGERNSYSKTDPDATFMRMKEDHMLNGQLKPAYNLQHGVDSEYITWLTVNPNPTDTKTLIPFLKDMERNLGFKYTDIVADAGYESEENYLFIESNNQTAYIKPKSYELSKKSRFKADIGRVENMVYDEEKDFYICKNDRKLTVQYEKQEKTETGYKRTTTIYSCADCSGCAYKTRCIKGNNCNTPMEQRVKTLYVSKTIKQKRKECLERITGPYGIQLRVNRSIQAEGSFASIKQDMEFRRYMYRGKANVTAQSVILAIAHNINKLHNKIQSGRTGHHLFKLKETA